MEALAVLGHVGLHRRRRSDSVARRGGRGRQLRGAGGGRRDQGRGRRGRRGAGDAHAHPVVQQEVGAARVGDAGVPFEKVGQVDVVAVGYGLACGGRGRDFVVLVAVLGDRGLDGGREHADAHVVVDLEVGACAVDGRVPAVEVGQVEPPVVGDGLARRRRGPHLVVLVAVASHRGLDGRGKIGGGRGSGRGAGGGGGSDGVADNAYAHIDVGPKTGAVRLDGWVPREQLCQGDAVLGQDGVAALALLYKVEDVAVGYHAGLDWGWGLDSVAGGRGRGGCRRRCCCCCCCCCCRSGTGLVPNYRHADVHVGPKACTVGLDGRVPREQLGDGELVCTQHVVARLPFSHEVELVAVAHHAGLRWAWGLDAIARRLGRRGTGRGGGGGAGAGGGRHYRRGSRAPYALYAVGKVLLEVVAGLRD